MPISNKNYWKLTKPSTTSFQNRSVQPAIKPNPVQIDSVHEISSAKSVVDVGCGNGTFARALIEKGFSGQYLGIDLSEGLLDRARALTGNPQQAKISFVFADLCRPKLARRNTPSNL